MVWPAMLKRLLVIGSGTAGIKFASFYRSMGAEVTIAEVVDHISRVEDGGLPPSGLSSSGASVS